MLAILFALASAITWGINPLFGRKALEKVDVYTTNFLGVLAGLALILGVSYFTGDLPRLPALRPDQLLIFGTAGLLGIVLGRTFYYVSMAKIGAGPSTSLTAASVLVAPAIAIAFLQEVIDIKMALGILMVFAGVYLISRRGQ